MRPEPLDIPNQDVELTEEFLQQHEIFMAFIAVALLDAVEPIPEATDYDVREALEALIKSLRGSESGIYYEITPDNQYAAAITTSIRARIADIRRRETEATGSTSLRDETLIGVLAFLQRLEYSRNNGRSRCRAFLDFLHGFYAPSGLRPSSASRAELGDPDAPHVIL